MSPLMALTLLWQIFAGAGFPNHFFCSFASGFTTSRAHSMKSFASGLRVRFFKVMIPTGNGGMGSVTGKTLSGGRFEPNRKTVSE